MSVISTFLTPALLERRQAVLDRQLRDIVPVSTSVGNELHSLMNRFKETDPESLAGVRLQSQMLQAGQRGGFSTGTMMRFLMTGYMSVINNVQSTLSLLAPFRPNDPTIQQRLGLLERAAQQIEQRRSAISLFG